MSTNAMVGLKYKDKIKYVRVYSDGYISHTGEILLREFNIVEAIEELFSRVTRDNIDRSFLEDRYKGYDGILNDARCLLSWEAAESFDNLCINFYDGVFESEDFNRIYTEYQFNDYFYIFDIEKNDWYWTSYKDRELKLLRDKFNIYSKTVTFYDYIEED